MCNPLARETRSSALHPDTSKRVARYGKVKRSKSMSPGVDEPMDFDQMCARVPATSTEHSTRDASENFK